MRSGADDRDRQSLVVLPGGVEAYTSSVGTQLRTDPEFQSLIPPLSPGEKAALQASLLEEGCRDPLSVWAEEKLLIDGHNRYAICTAHGIPYQTVEMSFDSRNAVKTWMILNQLGRRNLTPFSISYLRGTWYELTKQSCGGDRKSSGHFDHLKTEDKLGELTEQSCDWDKKSSGHFDHLKTEDKLGELTEQSCGGDRRSSGQNDHLKTEDKLGELFKVSPRTIRRDAQFAKAVDALGSIDRGYFKRTILNQSANLTKKEVISLAESVKRNPDKVAKVLQKRYSPPKSQDKPLTARHLMLKIGSLVEVYAPDREDVNGRLGRIQSVGEKTATVWMRHIPTLTMHLHAFKHSALTVVPLENHPDIQELWERTDRLHKSGKLDPFEIEILNLLERDTALTPTELQYLEQIENRYNEVRNQT